MSLRFGTNSVRIFPCFFVSAVPSAVFFHFGSPVGRVFPFRQPRRPCFSVSAILSAMFYPLPPSLSMKIKKQPKTMAKRARKAKPRLIRTRRGETDPCASFWPMLEKSRFLSTESKNRQEQLQNECAEPKLAGYEPEGGKPTLAHLSGMC